MLQYNVPCKYRIPLSSKLSLTNNLNPLFSLSKPSTLAAYSPFQRSPLHKKSITNIHWSVVIFLFKSNASAFFHRKIKGFINFYVWILTKHRSHLLCFSNYCPWRYPEKSFLRIFISYGQYP